jgi:hypothetical protein
VGVRRLLDALVPAWASREVWVAASRAFGEPGHERDRLIVSEPVLSREGVVGIEAERERDGGLQIPRRRPRRRHAAASVSAARSQNAWYGAMMGKSRASARAIEIICSFSLCQA